MWFWHEVAPELNCCDAHMHCPADAPLAEDMDFSRSMIAGVVTTDGCDAATGTGLSMVRVQPTIAANAAVLTARLSTKDVFMLGPPKG